MFHAWLLALSPLISNLPHRRLGMDLGSDSGPDPRANSWPDWIAVLGSEGVRTGSAAPTRPERGWLGGWVDGFGGDMSAQRPDGEGHHPEF